MAGRPRKNPQAQAKVKKEKVIKAPKEIAKPKEIQAREIKPTEIDVKQPDLPKELQLDKIIEKYNQLCNIPSDINELLPIIKEVASHCETCVEFGVRSSTSTYAILAGNPKSLVSYDIARYPEVDQVEELAPNFTFVLGSSLEVDIEETDMILYDTYHTQTQLERELARHGNKAQKYQIFHDTESFRFRGENPYPGIVGNVDCGRGIWPAIENFLSINSHWKIDFVAKNNNGLTVLRRIK